LGNQQFIHKQGNYKMDQLPNFYAIKGDKIMFSAKPINMDKANRIAFSEPGFSTNMKNSSLNKREKLLARILETKFYTNPSGDPGGINRSD
jgi:hypothetical protein